MSKKEDLIRKLLSKPMPTNFTTRELDGLMKKCGCSKFEGGRGSGIGYVHDKTKRIVQFDGPHPGNELYRYQIKMIINFLKEIGEI
ncbi:type II toxin-antitoxin system HicA family toxin [Oribacterium sp. P6A1]|uniref:type II toxin-antitoxin system HicA family toxin n=1 Tax=Oribacterium sp. P6A1 TaxID=1410612 RepID=UPI0005686DBF|nr:type II toxin-antitoxin system HicA family toxin [Oribacterium sp. P6A1]